MCNHVGLFQQSLCPVLQSINNARRLSGKVVQVACPRVLSMQALARQYTPSARLCCRLRNMGRCCDVDLACSNKDCSIDFCIQKYLRTHRAEGQLSELRTRVESIRFVHVFANWGSGRFLIMLLRLCIQAGHLCQRAHPLFPER